MPENEAVKTDGQFVFLNLQRWKWWVLVAFNIVFLLVGQSAAVLLGRFYYDKGGKSKWLATLVQTAAFPIFLIPLFLLPFSQKPQPSTSSPSSHPSLTTLFSIYFFLGVLLAADNMMYSTGLLYLSASTYSLICATQLAFNAIFSFFINKQKFNSLILNSVIALSVSASLIAINDDSSEPSGVSKWKYSIGFLSTLAASATYALLLSLMQLSFERVIRNEIFFAVVLEMQIYTSLVATAASLVGLFASGEWKSLRGEMGGFLTGSVSYVMTLVWTAVAWQVCSLGVVGLIFVVSSLFSNLISTVSLALVPLVSVMVFHDRMNGVKIIAIVLAFWGFGCYIYQNFIDDRRMRGTCHMNQNENEGESPIDSSLV